MEHSVLRRLLGLVLSVMALPAVCLSAAPGRNVTISRGSMTVADLIQEVEAQTDYLFVYNPSEVDLSRKVSVSASDEPAVEVIASAFAGTDIAPMVEGRNIVLGRVQPAGDASKPGELSGTVRDESGLPVIGASILIKGTKEGTFTDVDGKFSMFVPQGAILEVSSIGYLTQEVNPAGLVRLDVTLRPDAQLLEETIVIGYGTAKKRDFVGSVSSLGADDISRTAPVSVESVLQGMAAGVQVNSGVGVPGATQQVKVRGVSSISSGTDPLWIVDGVPVQTDYIDFNNDTPNQRNSDGEAHQSVLAMLNPNDIESVQVLKDAAATAIYGSRGANGVILVTTKSGRSGTPKVSVDLKSGISGWAHRDIGLADSAQWFEIAETAMQNTMHTSYDVSTTFGNLDGSPEIMTTAQAKQVNTDWGKEISRTGSFYEANVSLSSGTDKASSYVSLKYRKDNGNLRHNQMETFGANVKVGYKLGKWADVNYRLAATYTDNDRIKSTDGKNGLGGFAQVNTNALPWYKVYSDTGLGGYWNSLSSVNPVASADPKNSISNLKTVNVMSALTGTIRLPLEGLSLKGEWGLNYVNSHMLSWRSDAITVQGAQARELKKAITVNNYNAYFDYTRTFGIHDINATAGVENTRRSAWTSNLRASGLVGTFREVGTPTTLSGSSGFGDEEYLRGYFARANYKLLDRYIISASARRDGISKFSKDNRWANFFSAGAGWIVSDEPWFKVPAVSLLKLRGSVGQTGNTNVPYGITADVWDIITGNQTLEGYNVSRLKSIGNTNVKWETTTSYDAGVDFGLLGNRINGSVAYYRQNVSDMILAVSMPESAGIKGGNVNYANAGDMYNHGIEFEVYATLMEKRDFSWRAGFNISTNANKVTALDPVSDANGAGILNDFNNDGVFYNIIKKGVPYGTYYMAEYAGVDKQKGIPMIYEVETLADGSTRHTGNIIPATTENMTNNIMVLKDKTSLPKVVGGLSTSVTWKQFDASAVLSFVAGNWIYSRLIQSTMTPNAGMLALNSKLLTDSWRQPGDDTDVPQINAGCYYYYDNDGNPSSLPVQYGSENKTPSTRFLERGDYLKLRNLTVGYTLPAKAARKCGLDGVRVYVSGSNLFTLTGFSGYDPEVEIDQYSGGAIEALFAMPTSRVLMFGVNLNF